ncbi:hypothetical protein, partial [Phascolarctobacterium succinatutens]|uniref:hypothetical protein n=1 Tax=Phascolarctobacterium succinatutens TaxID=626940 RepID=UPI0026F044CF
IYLARYHTAIPVFHIFNFLSAKSAAKPAPQIYSRKYCSVKRKTPPALRPTALASFPCFSKKSFPYFGGFSKPAYLFFWCRPLANNIYRGILYIFLFAPYCQLFPNH